MTVAEQNRRHRFWMNLAFGYIVALFVSVVVLFFNLSSIYISISCFILCFISVIGAKICFSRADQYLAPAYVMQEDNMESSTLQSTTIEQLEVAEQNNETSDEKFNEDQVEVKTVELVEAATQSKEELMIENEPVEDNHLDDEEDILLNIDGLEDNGITENKAPLAHQTEDKEIEVIVEAVIKEGNPAKNYATLTLFETEILNKIIEILKEQNREIQALDTKKVGNYFDVITKSSILRFKLGGRKQYLLSQLSEEELVEKGLTFEGPSKNEKYKSRVILTSSDVLTKLADYIVENFDKSC